MDNQRVKNLTLFFLILAIILVLIAGSAFNPRETRVEYFDFYRDFDEGQITEIVVSEREIRWRKAGTKKLYVATAALDQGDIKLFRSKEIKVKDPDDPTKTLSRIKVKFEHQNENPWWISFASTWLPFVILIGVWFYFLQKMQGGGAKALSFGKSRARFIDSSKTQTTFDDVAGCDEAKSDLQEIIEFLKAPRKFAEIGARIPRGVLLMGPPGTGKTLLARAVAGEAKVPFLHISGSDFVEMFVGVGASRVRDLFEQGKKHAPCLLFIDEIDAVGRQRGAGLGGGHDEREQTLNQLLVEMDGFDTNEGVIMIAATNRPDVLDPALLRPGRFDRQIVVDLPDIKGREGIFRVHTKKIPLTDDVDLAILARATPGFSGADIANMVNEAALLAARRDRKRVNMEDFEDARDKIIMGQERKSRILSDPIKERIAYHEAGHALISKLIGGQDAVHKISVIPRGRALGVTSFLPEEDRMYIRNRTYLLDSICGLLGGRVAEELRFGEISSGAANDIEKATKIVHQMVCEFGMSATLGPVTYGEDHSLVFLGRDITRERNYSEETAHEIDLEVKRIITEAYEKTRQLLQENFDKLDILAKALLVHEVLDGSQVDRLLEGEELPPPVTPKRGPSSDAAPSSDEDPSGHPIPDAA
ncbi:MAG: ATP-dependent zinc metalloprotease FtsH [Candidatus Riflebacteria bacterium]|nr:ATP-dependent zinc metalloprotease FtsH [Candidatus Riflebacteria bacterium]